MTRPDERAFHVWGPRLFVLLEDGETLAEVHDYLDWARWQSEHDCQIRLTVTEHFTVSTVFLGIDHRFSGKGPPIVWETMVFANDPADEGGELHHSMWRYSTRSDAEAGHAMAVKKAIAGEKVG